MSSNYKIGLEEYRLILETAFEANNPIILGSQVTNLIVTTMEVKGASIFIVNPKTEELEILATEGLSMSYVNKGPILVDKSIKLASNLKPVIITDIKNGDLLQYPEKAEREGIRAIISLPINIRGKIIGAMRIYHSEPWDISEEELSYLKLLTKSLGMELKYFRLSAVIQSTREMLDEIHPIWL